MTYGNGALIKCLCTINDYIIEEGLDLSTYADTLEKKKYPEDMVNDVRITIINIRESLREICPEPKLINPDVPDLYYRGVVEEMNKIKDKPITINDLMKVNLAMIGLFEEYTIPNSKSDDKPNDTLGLLK